MNKSESIKELATALAKFQATVEAVKRDSTNPFFKSKYADLSSIIEVIRKPLSDQGLSFSQFPTGDGSLTTLLMHSSGEWIEDTFTLKSVDAKPQSIGSALTYSRRYALGAVLGLATEVDDDANSAQGPAPAPSGLPAPYRVRAAPGTRSQPAKPREVVPDGPNGAPFA